MVQIAKEFEFEAAHQLESHDGQCANIHGHSYRLRVTLKGIPREQEDAKEGFVIDFKELKQRVKTAFLDEWEEMRRVYAFIESNGRRGYSPPSEKVIIAAGKEGI